VIELIVAENLAVRHVRNTPEKLNDTIIRPHLIWRLLIERENDDLDSSPSQLWGDLYHIRNAFVNLSDRIHQNLYLLRIRRPRCARLRPACLLISPQPRSGRALGARASGPHAFSSRRSHAAAEPWVRGPPARMSSHLAAATQRRSPGCAGLRPACLLISLQPRSGRNTKTRFDASFCARFYSKQLGGGGMRV